jgi:hypothetical protein
MEGKYQVKAMRSVLARAAVILALAWPACATACDGTAGRDVAITFDGQKYTVTDTGRQSVQVAFTAFGTTYNLQLAPGQSDTPRSPGMFSQPMAGYQSCVATPVAVVSPGVSALRTGR